MRRNENTCRTIIDAMGWDVDPQELAKLANRANYAYSRGDMDSYQNQCDFIQNLLTKGAREVSRG